jgi:23S rRNA pseudouridine955/2504/2580 synthase
MKEIVISDKDAGGRLDKYLKKIFPSAPGALLYKQLRKKNITLNGHKADGSEKINKDDVIKVFFSDETFDAFSKTEGSKKTEDFEKAYKSLKGIEVLYEDDDIIAVNKPAGVLTQKADDKDMSLNEWLVGYLKDKKGLTEDDIKVYKPSAANRLDRNTSGIVLCAKTLKGSRCLSSYIKERRVGKYYHTFVKGKMPSESDVLKGYLKKDSKDNKVTIVDISDDEALKPGFSPVITSYKVLSYHDDKKEGFDYSYLEIELVTGKSHQIRAHLASIGHPLLGDVKYGDPKINKMLYNKYGVKNQLLHSSRVEFDSDLEECEKLRGLVINCKDPKYYGNLEKQGS